MWYDAKYILLPSNELMGVVINKVVNKKGIVGIQGMMVNEVLRYLWGTIDE